MNTYVQCKWRTTLSIHKMTTPWWLVQLVTMEAVDLETGAELAEQGVVVELPFQTGSVLSLVTYRFERRDGGTALRALLTCSDHSLHLISSAGEGGNTSLTLMIC